MSAKAFISAKKILDSEKPITANQNKRNSIAITNNNFNFGISLAKKSPKQFYNSHSKFNVNTNNLENNMQNFLNNYDELLENLTGLNKKNNNPVTIKLDDNKQVYDHSPSKKRLDHRKSVLLEPNFNFRNNILGLTQTKNINSSQFNREISLEPQTNERHLEIITEKVKTPKTKKSNSSNFNYKFLDIFSMISKVQKKNDTPKSLNNLEIVKSFTNTEEIKDFYEYTSECLKRVSLLKRPSKKELEELYLELPISKKELQSNIFLIF